MLKVYIGNDGRRERYDLIRDDPRLGQMLLPGYLSPKQMSCTFALDNGAFGAYVNNRVWDSLAFMEAILKAQENINLLDFSVLPDKVAQGQISYRFSKIWREFLPDTIPWYLAIQDGMIESIISEEFVEKIAGIFIGGTREWKTKTAQEWVEWGHQHDLKVHIGRVGTEKLLLWAEGIGADSVDSTNFSQNLIHWEELNEYLDGNQKTL